MEGLIIFNSMQHLPPPVEGAEYMSRVVLVDHNGEWRKGRYYFSTGKWLIDTPTGFIDREGVHVWTWLPIDLQRKLEVIVSALTKSIEDMDDGKKKATDAKTVYVLESSKQTIGQIIESIKLVLQP